MTKAINLRKYFMLRNKMLEECSNCFNYSTLPRGTKPKNCACYENELN